MTEIIKKSFGITRDEMQFEDKGKISGLPEYDDSVEGIQKNPVNKILSVYSEKLLSNERKSAMQFDMLDELLEKYDKLVSSSSYYDKMDVVKLMGNVINYYQMWALSFRDTILMNKKTINEIIDIVNRYYLSKSMIDGSSDKLIAEENKKLKEIIKELQNKMVSESSENIKEGVFKKEDINTIIMGLHKQGYSYRRIANKLIEMKLAKMSYTTISDTIKRIKAEQGIVDDEDIEKIEEEVKEIGV